FRGGDVNAAVHARRRARAAQTALARAGPTPVLAGPAGLTGTRARRAGRTARGTRSARRTRRAARPRPAAAAALAARHVGPDHLVGAEVQAHGPLLAALVEGQRV